MQRKTVLVTGGTGYIGSHTIINLYEHGYLPISVDNGMNSDISSLSKIEDIIGVRIKHYNIDLQDLTKTETIFKEQKIDAIIHFAALKAVGESVEKPFLYFRNNLNSLLNVQECAQKYGVKAFIFSSSCTVYGEVKSSPVDEYTELQPAESPYGRTKQMGEEIIEDCIKKSDMKAVLLRYFNPAGAHLSAKIGESPINTAQNLVPVITETAIGSRPCMKVFGNDYDTRDGTCVRDYIHIMDLAEAHTLALDFALYRQQNQVEVFNLGSGSGYTVLEAINAFETVNNVKLSYEISARRPGDVVAIYSSYEKAKNQLYWQPKYGIKEIMQSAWEWEKNRNLTK